MPVEPRAQLVERLLDGLGHLRRCWPPGTSRRPASGRAVSSTTASPISGWWSSTTSATSPSRRRPVVSSTAPWPRSSGVAIGRTCWICEALVRRVDEPAGARRRRLQEVSGETHSALPVVSMTWSSVTPLSRRLLRVDLHLQLPLALAPDRDVGDARHAHQPRPDRPAGEDRLLDRATAPWRRQPDHHHPARRRQRLQHRRRLETLGRAWAWVRRSCTSCRARRRRCPARRP